MYCKWLAREEPHCVDAPCTTPCFRRLCFNKQDIHLQAFITSLSSSMLQYVVLAVIQSIGCMSRVFKNLDHLNTDGSRAVRVHIVSMNLSRSKARQLHRSKTDVAISSSRQASVKTFSTAENVGPEGPRTGTDGPRGDGGHREERRRVWSCLVHSNKDATR